MSRYRVSVHIVPRKGILDPQGKAVADALHTLGFRDVEDARIGRHVVLDVAARTPDAAGDAVRQMCERLLANPVTEDYEIARVEGLS
ncbi:MAG TPA: phosphoribosylformylglycinamidine synthase subunit PurS [Gemmatimonadaceae bacterium]|nr:phosphoribosylformylglycinamidine synthase subunit PurS [Gemmatimonadaceae bacterium]HSC31181.1 phosphoribosylformylglycinamidine synthase subunit PurS [Gemmatimonadaceae bacterium]